MVTRRNGGFSASQSKNTSRRMRSATIGTHVSHSSRHMNADQVGFSSTRKQKRAARGYVENVMPTAGDVGSQASRRVSRREFTQDIRRRARIRRIITLSVGALVVVGIAISAGVFAFFGSLDGKLALKDSDVTSALVSVDDGAPFYTVVAADLDMQGATNLGDGPDAIALVRVDPTTKAATIISIPNNTQVSLKDGNLHELREATSLDGDAALVSAVANLTGIDVSHYVEIDAAGIVQLVDALGGLEVDVAEEVDDPAAGDVYVPAGTQTVDGAAALTVLRASNYTDGEEVQATNQRAILKALSLRMLGDDSFGFLTLLDTVGGTFQTDVGAHSAQALSDSLRGMSADAVFGARLPGYDLTNNDVEYYATLSDDVSAMMERVEAGEDPALQEDSSATVDPASFTITVRNGSEITGAATQITEVLTNAGFKVEETGNADQFVYDETLVIYKDEAFLPAAQTVVQALSAGRTVAGGDFYTFETDVLVILGSDWKPIT